MVSTTAKIRSRHTTPGGDLATQREFSRHPSTHAHPRETTWGINEAPGLAAPRQPHAHCPGEHAMYVLSSIRLTFNGEADAVVAPRAAMPSKARAPAAPPSHHLGFISGVAEACTLDSSVYACARKELDPLQSDSLVHVCVGVLMFWWARAVFGCFFFFGETGDHTRT